MWGWIAATAAGYLLNQLSQPDAPEQPDIPAKVPPEWSPMWAFDDFTHWQHQTRNDLLMQFYGGRLVDAPANPYREPNYVGSLIDLADKELKPEETENVWDDIKDQIDPGGTQMRYPNATSDNKFVRFTGDKPSQQYLGGHGALLKQADKGFEKQLESYLRSKGMAGEGGASALAGASQEQKRDFKQLGKEINARASEIKTQTLGQLFGEVSDAGQQTAQFANAMQQGTQMWNQMANQRYNQMMQDWQWQAANQQPSFGQQFAAFAGQTLPYAFMGGGGTPGVQ